MLETFFLYVSNFYIRKIGTIWSWVEELFYNFSSLNYVLFEFVSP